MQSPASSPSSRRNVTVAQWVIAGLLAVIAVGVWTRGSDPIERLVHAQPAPLAGARGVFAFTGPIERDRYGLFMLDVDQGTIWCYAFDTVGGTRKLKLIAARSWVYDRYLQDFNCAEPTFRDIQALVNQQRDRGSGPPRGGESPPEIPADDAGRSDQKD